MKKGRIIESPGYTLLGVLIVAFAVFVFSGGEIPFLQKTEAAVKHIRYDIKGITGMPVELQKQFDQGKSVLDYENKKYVVIKTEAPEFSHITAVKQEGDRIVVYKQRYRDKISVYTIPPFLVEVDATNLPIVVEDQLVENVYPGKELKKEWEKERNKLFADFFAGKLS